MASTKKSKKIRTRNKIAKRKKVRSRKLRSKTRKAVKSGVIKLQ